MKYDRQMMNLLNMTVVWNKKSNIRYTSSDIEIIEFKYILDKNNRWDQRMYYITD